VDVHEAVIFDLDGTLADTLTDLAEAMNYALQQLDCPAHPVQAYRYMVGSGRRQLCRAALPDDRQDLLDRSMALMTEYYAKHCFDHTVLYDGVAEMLGRLNEMNIPLAVLSNKPDNFVQLTVSRLMGQFQFAAVVGEDDKLARKPAPDGALLIAKRMRIQPEHIVYLGDTSIDMQTAQAAGMFGVGATWGFRDAEELTRAGAKALIDHPRELLRFFNQPL